MSHALVGHSHTVKHAFECFQLKKQQVAVVEMFTQIVHCSGDRRDVKTIYLELKFTAEDWMDVWPSGIISYPAPQTIKVGLCETTNATGQRGTKLIISVYCKDFSLVLTSNYSSIALAIKQIPLTFTYGFLSSSKVSVSLGFGSSLLIHKSFTKEMEMKRETSLSYWLTFGLVSMLRMDIVRNCNLYQYISFEFLKLRIYWGCSCCPVWSVLKWLNILNFQDLQFV